MPPWHCRCSCRYSGVSMSPVIEIAVFLVVSGLALWLNLALGRSLPPPLTRPWSEGGRNLTTGQLRQLLQAGDAFLERHFDSEGCIR